MTNWWEEEKKRFCSWEYQYLVDRIKDDGWTFTEFVHTAMICYLDIVDPVEHQKKQKIQKMLPELKVLRPGNGKKMYSGSGSGVHQNPEYLVLRQHELQNLGEILRSNPKYAKIERDLVRLEPSEDGTWETIIEEFAAMGLDYEFSELWNDAVDWWNQYGKATAKPL